MNEMITTMAACATSPVKSSGRTRLDGRLRRLATAVLLRAFPPSDARATVNPGSARFQMVIEDEPTSDHHPVVAALCLVGQGQQGES